MVEPFAKVYAAFRRCSGSGRKWAFEGRTYGVAEGDDRAPQTWMKGWKATISFREFQFGEREYLKDKKRIPAGTEKPNGGVAIAQIGRTNSSSSASSRVKLTGSGANAGKPSMFARVEEGRFDKDGKWIMERNWNGDQTDYGLNLPATPWC
jgi:hypothetical protein